MKEEQPPGKISAGQLATDSGFTERHLRDLAKKGIIPPPRRGVYDEVPALKALLKYRITLCEEAESGMAASRKAYLDTKTAVDEQKRIKLETENAQAGKQFVEVAKLRAAFEEMNQNQNWLLRRIFREEMQVRFSKLMPPPQYDHLAFDTLIWDAMDSYSKEWYARLADIVNRHLGPTPPAQVAPVAPKKK